MRLMVIVGAGASFDSVPREDFTVDMNGLSEPPIADKLFELGRPEVREALRHAPEISGYVPSLRRALEEGSSLEGRLAQLERDSVRNPDRRTTLLSIQQYLGEVVSRTTEKWWSASAGLTNYATLVDFLEDSFSPSSIVYVSFNYDLLLDRALRCHQQSPQESITPSGAQLIKPHGSINWRQEVLNARVDPGSGLGPRETVMELARREGLQPGRIFLIDPTAHGDSFPWGTVGQPEAYAPAIAVPTDDKDRFVCAPDQVRALEEAVQAVTHVITIGWRGQEPTFLNLFANRNDFFHVLSVCENREAGEATLDALAAGGMLKDRHSSTHLRAAYSGGGFSPFVRESGALWEFLTDKGPSISFADPAGARMGLEPTT